MTLRRVTEHSFSLRGQFRGRSRRFRAGRWPREITGATVEAVCPRAFYHHRAPIAASVRGGWGRRERFLRGVGPIRTTRRRCAVHPARSSTAPEGAVRPSSERLSASFVLLLRRGRRACACGGSGLLARSREFQVRLRGRSCARRLLFGISMSFAKPGDRSDEFPVQFKCRNAGPRGHEIGNRRALGESVQRSARAPHLAA